LLGLEKVLMMSVPVFHEMLLPILHHVSDGEPHRPNDTLAYVSAQFPLSEQDLSERLPNGRTRLMDRVLWAITYLRKSKLIESVSWGVFRITDRGQTLLGEKPRAIGLKDLERYPEYLEFKGRSSRTTAVPVAEDRSSQETPEEQLERLVRSIRIGVEAELLEAFKTATPIFFEKIVLSLLVAMGYGGSRDDAANSTKRSGDDGIDGVIKEDRLGLDLIHIQAKRWTDKVVGRPDIQNFAGSLEGQRGRRGVFITTSTFSTEAREYISRIEKKIVLIDGAGFASLCFDFGIGVSSETPYVVKKLNSDFFIEE
jgi:restriction system protein